MPRPAIAFRQGNFGARFAGRPISSSVFVTPQNTQPQHLQAFVPRGFIGEFRPAHPVPHNVFIDQTARFRFRRSHHGLAFCDSLLDFPFHRHHFGLFHHHLSCFPHRFVHPFLLPFATVAGPSVLLVPAPMILAQAPPAKSSPEEPLPGEPFNGAYAPSVEPDAQRGAAAADEKKPLRPLTLLQLEDGWMYGLTDYWVEGGRLHYITSYGGQNSVPFERIDFDKTLQLNAERGVEFVLRPRPAVR